MFQSDKFETIVAMKYGKQYGRNTVNNTVEQQLYFDMNYIRGGLLLYSFLFFCVGQVMYLTSNRLCYFSSTANLAPIGSTHTSMLAWYIHEQISAL